MNKMLLTGLVALVLVAGWVFVTNKPRQESQVPQTDKTASQEKNAENKNTPNTVEIKNFAFGPATLTIKAGESVTFINKDLIGHTATADDESFDTEILAQNESKTITFDKAGTYSYYCIPHPNMKGTIVVQ